MRGAALDGVAEGFLSAVGLGQIVLVEEEEADGQDGGDGDDGNDEAVEADAGGLHGDDFAVAVEHAEGDEGGDEHGERGDLVEHVGGEVDEVIADGGERNVIAEDVADQIEEGEDEHEQDEAGEDEQKHAEEFADNVFVEDAGKGVAGFWAQGTELEPIAKACEGEVRLGAVPLASGFWSRENQAVMVARTWPPLAICQRRKMPTAAKSMFADQTARKAGSLFWRPRAVVIIERR